MCAVCVSVIFFQHFFPSIWLPNEMKPSENNKKSIGFFLSPSLIIALLYRTDLTVYFILFALSKLYNFGNVNTWIVSIRRESTKTTTAAAETHVIMDRQRNGEWRVRLMHRHKSAYLNVNWVFRVNDERAKNCQTTIDLTRTTTRFVCVRFCYALPK